MSVFLYIFLYFLWFNLFVLLFSNRKSHTNMVPGLSARGAVRNAPDSISIIGGISQQMTQFGIMFEFI